MIIFDDDDDDGNDNDADVPNTDDANDVRNTHKITLAVCLSIH